MRQTYIVHLDDRVFAESGQGLLLQNKMPPFPKRLKRTLIFDPGTVTTIFSTTNIAPPAKKGVKKTDRLIRVGDELPLLDGINVNVPAVPRRRYL